MKWLPRDLSHLFLSISIVFGMGVHTYAQQSARLPKPEQIHSLIRFYEEERGFNGNILISEEGDIIYENSTGWADNSRGIPMTLNTPFYLASVSKQFTAAAILLLKERGMLKLDDKLTKYVPEMGSYASKISIRHLLNHTSGLPDYFAMGWDEPGLTNALLFDKLQTNTRQLKLKPGNKYRYNNTGYVLLSIVVEKVSGEPYYMFVEKNICDPLGLENTWVFDLRNSQRNQGQKAIGYELNMRRVNDYNLLTTGDGGMYSTIEDLFIWDRSLYTNELLSQESLEQAFQPLALANGSTENYGFGWNIGENLNGKTVYHSGGLAGFRTYIERQLEVDNTIIILNNNSFDDIAEMRNILVKILDGRPYELPIE